MIEMNIKRQEIFNQEIKIEPSRITITPLDQQLIEKAIAIVEDNINETEFSVEELASSLNISRSYFYKKMIKITGKKPIEFIRTIRMKRAQQLLTESQMQISEIAYILGYNSPKVFSKHFKDEFNISPSEFIRQHSRKYKPTKKKMDSIRNKMLKRHRKNRFYSGLCLQKQLLPTNNKRETLSSLIRHKERAVSRKESASLPNNNLFKINKHETNLQLQGMGFCIAMLLTTTWLSAQTDTSIPKLIQKNGRYTLLVDNKPFFVLGGQCGNSSNWASMLPNVWNVMKEMHANTLEIPVYWEQLEPQEGKFDFSQVQSVLNQARQNNMRLIFLWFATWKNGSNHYMPEWMKTDSKKYPNVVGKMVKK